MVGGLDQQTGGIWEVGLSFIAELLGIIGNGQTPHTQTADSR